MVHSCASRIARCRLVASLATSATVLYPWAVSSFTMQSATFAAIGGLSPFSPAAVAISFRYAGLEIDVELVAPPEVTARIAL